MKKKYFIAHIIGPMDDPEKVYAVSSFADSVEELQDELDWQNGEHPGSQFVIAICEVPEKKETE